MYFSFILQSFNTIYSLEEILNYEGDLADDLMLTFHIDWLLSLDESILTTDKYLNWILSNGDADNENWVDTEEHNSA